MNALTLEQQTEVRGIVAGMIGQALRDVADSLAAQQIAIVPVLTMPDLVRAAHATASTVNGEGSASGNDAALLPHLERNRNNG